jgi:hypothetical protein
MLRTTPWPAAAALLLGVLLALTPARAGAPAGGEAESLPRFTEEREAAALFFVKKHLPELLPLLEQLKKNNHPHYEHEIREIFQETEMLADLQDDPKRYELELKVWTAENKANALVARLSTPSAEERQKVEGELEEIAKELVDLDIQVLELKAEELDKELGEVRDELTRMRESLDKQIKERYEGLLDKAKRRKKQ